MMLTGWRGRAVSGYQIHEIMTAQHTQRMKQDRAESGNDSNSDKVECPFTAMNNLFRMQRPEGAFQTLLYFFFKFHFCDYDL